MKTLNNSNISSNCENKKNYKIYISYIYDLINRNFKRK